jgi:hypothetical protein
MRTIKNISGQKFEVPFDFNTYTFQNEKKVRVEQKLFEFLLERWPLSFSFNEKTEKDTPVVESVKTKSYLPSKEDAKELGTDFMSIHNTEPEATFGTPDGLPPDGRTDKDGVAFYGPGIEQDSV